VVLVCILRWILRADGRIDEIEIGEIAVQFILYIGFFFLDFFEKLRGRRSQQCERMFSFSTSNCCSERESFPIMSCAQINCRME
jgi:hypothetical protein